MSEEEEWKMMRGREKKDWKLWVSCRVSGSRCVEGKVQGTYKRLQRAAGKGLGKEKPDWVTKDGRVQLRTRSWCLLTPRDKCRHRKRPCLCWREAAAVITHAGDEHEARSRISSPPSCCRPFHPRFAANITRYQPHRYV